MPLAIAHEIADVADGARCSTSARRYRQPDRTPDRTLYYLPTYLPQSSTDLLRRAADRGARQQVYDEATWSTRTWTTFICDAADRVRVDTRRRNANGSGACPYVTDSV